MNFRYEKALALKFPLGSPLAAYDTDSKNVEKNYFGTHLLKIHFRKLMTKLTVRVIRHQLQFY